MYKFFTFFSFGYLVISQSPKAQSGCQDPQAQNFNSAATSTDTSCQYSLSTKEPSWIFNLPVALNEASALLQTDGKWFTINDSGNPADVFQISPQTGQILKTTRIQNHSNIDWEDLAADALHIYVGDFGNNNGNRTNLRILKVRKSALYHPDTLQVNAQKLEFSYPDQSSFVSSSNHNFDCEGFFYLQGRLHLFSKNRGNQKTKHYSLDPNLANQVAILHDSLSVNGLITSASISPDGKVVSLLGHENGVSLMVFNWLLFGFQGTDFFGGNRRRIDHNNMLFNGQTEGIGFLSSDTLIMSNERLGTIPAAIRKIEVGSFFNPFFASYVNPISSRKRLNLFPNPASGWLSLPIELGERFVLYNYLGENCLQGVDSQVFIGSLPEGVYRIFIFGEKGYSTYSSSICIIN
jgi:hypothetical protein